MKVLHVIPSVGPLRGGPSFAVQAMTKGLAARGCEVHVATTNDNGAELLSVPLGRAVPRDGVTYWYFPRTTHFYLFSSSLSRWLALRVRDYDLVHIHTLFSFPAIRAAHWAHRHGVPYVVRPLGTLNRWGMEHRRPWLKQLSLRLIDGPVLSRAAAVHFTSEGECQEAAETALQRHGIQRSAIIPNPVDFPLDRETVCVDWLRRRHPQLANKKRILFLSRLDPTKGLDLLLAAFARLRVRLPDVALILGGAGVESFERRLRQSAAVLGVEEDVVWLGFLEGERKKAALAWADVFVLSSYSESFGIAAVEAMAAGLAVVVSDRVGIHREITAAGAGLAVPCDAENLANALMRLLTDAPLRSEMARRGQLLSATFSSAKVSGLLMDLYCDLLANGRPKDPACVGVGKES
jgi:glycosyltransferase involved in cell wall biosynthesis